VTDVVTTFRTQRDVVRNAQQKVAVERTSDMMATTASRPGGSSSLGDFHAPISDDEENFPTITAPDSPTPVIGAEGIGRRLVALCFYTVFPALTTLFLSPSQAKVWVNTCVDSLGARSIASYLDVLVGGSPT
jgi:hypothetical protein